MNYLESALSWATLSFEVALCGFVFARKVQRSLPFFALYSYLILAGTVVVWLTYQLFGFASTAAIYAYWTSVLINAVVRSLAIAELCRYGLREYQGIWALVWRALAVLAGVLVLHSAVDAWGQPSHFAIYGLTLDRDLAFASILLLSGLLVIRSYYGLALQPFQRAIAGGICFVCAVDVVGDTLVRQAMTGDLFSWFLSSQKALWPVLRPQIRHLNDIWSTVHLLCFMLAMAIWAYALRKPLPEPAEKPALLPADVYREMSPAINMRLASLNDRLLELLKP